LGGLAALAAAAGGAAVGAALAGLPDPWAGYVSEAGVPGSPRAALYRAGLLGLSAALVLLAAALAGPARVAGALLLGGGLLGTLSAAVPCTPGCPLPPYQSTTAADLLHAGASALAVAAVVLAMLALAAVPQPCRPAIARLRHPAIARLRHPAIARLRHPAIARLRRGGRIGFAVTAPPVAALGLALLLLGRGPVTGLLERGVLALTFGWLLVTSALLATDPGAGGDPNR
jgi:hypothetical protein